ncbi:hypothetical protein [Streptomyces sp. NBC_00842]|uniref:hypothetical protein n=1 Tax=Streptomyces sp. NBC_00842 TaxID=2975848 RepID=UPI00386900E4|nr:hypothetical protein OH821_17045 [Streptomyces sp. NBC_00842]
MTNFATQLTTLVTQIADAAECEFWQCHLQADGKHHECCLTGGDTTEATTAA